MGAIITELPNGMRIVTSHVSGIQSVALGLWLSVGSRYESPELSGASHFIEHMLFKGTKKYSAHRISQEIEGRGGYLNAFTQEESTCYYARIASKHTSKALSVLMDMYRFPELDDAEVERERGVILEEMLMYRDQPHHVAEDLLAAALWRKHPLGRPVIGTQESVRRMMRKDIWSFMRRHYRARSTVIAAAGDIIHDQLVDYVQRYSCDSSYIRHSKARPFRPEYPQDAFSFSIRNIEQAQLALGFRLFGRHDKRRFSLKLLSIILGENMSSRLFQVVREKYGMAYSIQSAIQHFADTGGLLISAGVDTNKTESTLRLILRETRRLMLRRVSTRELDAAKDYAIGQMQLGMESSTNQMLWAGEAVISYGKWISPEEIRVKLEKVSSDHIQELARQIFIAPRLSVAIVSSDRAPGRQKLLGEIR